MQPAVFVIRDRKRGIDDNICVSCAEIKGRKLPDKTRPYWFFVNAILPELPGEYVNVGETSSVMLWHRRLGHINAQSSKKLTQAKDTEMVVKDTDFSVSNCDTCALPKGKQQNHPKEGLIEVTQPLELVYTDLSGPVSSASGAGNSYVANFTGHHTHLKSVYFLSKKNEAIDALINYTQDVVIPSGHRLQRLRSDRGGEYTGLEYREYCLQTGITQEFAATNTPQQNGISEREWASLWNMTRCFLAEAGVPKYLW